MTTFAGQATVVLNSATTALTGLDHAFRASVLASGNHPDIITGSALVAGADQPFDLAAGASLRVASAFDSTTSAGTPNAGDLLCHVILCNEAGTQLRSVQVIDQAGGWTLGSLIQGTAVTFFATSDGTSTGTPKAGTYQLAVSCQYATRTADAVNGAYAVNTIGTDSRSGTPNTWDSPAPAKDKGYLRASTTVTLAVSGSGTRSYGDTLALSADLADVLLQNATLTLALGPGTGTSNSTTDNHTRNQAVDNTYPVAATSYTPTVAAPNSSLSGIAHVLFTTTTASAVTVDPRLTIQLYMQLNDTALNTPPDGTTDLTHNVTSKLASDIGLVAIRVKNARAEGINSITFSTNSITAVDRNLLTSPIIRAGNNFTSNTLNGALGWVTASSGLGGANPNFLSWASAQPGGTWDFAYTLSGPAGAVGLGTASPQQLVMLSQNPNIRLVAYFGGPSDETGDHWSPGNPLTLSFTIDNIGTHTFIQPVNPSIGLRRYVPSTDSWEYLRKSDLTWQLVGSNTADVFTTTSTPAIAASADGLGWTLTFTANQTASWGLDDMEGVFVGSDSSGTPYSVLLLITVLSANNKHSGYTLDAVGLALSGKLSFQ